MKVEVEEAQSQFQQKEASMKQEIEAMKKQLLQNKQTLQTQNLLMQKMDEANYKLETEKKEILQKLSVEVKPPKTPRLEDQEKIKTLEAKLKENEQYIEKLLFE